MTYPKIALSASHPDKLAEAKKLAALLHLELITDVNETAIHYDYLLVLTSHYLGLKKMQDKKSKPFFIDFLSCKLHYRRQKASLRKELLARAMGVSPTQHPHPFILDATAGLGRDSFILASLQYRVTMIERSPLLHALLQDGMRRAKEEPNVATIIERLHLINADAITWLSQHSSTNPPDIIYLDPMFPHKRKSSAVKKEMVMLQDLLDNTEADDHLLTTALSCANKRVVVKRSRYAAPLAEHPPSFSIEGNSSRFDIYLV